MSKQNGLGDRLLSGGYNVSGDVGSIQRVNGGPSPLVVTGIDKSAFERIGGKRDGNIDFTSFFNPATNASHDVFSALPTANVLVSYLRGTSLGSPAACTVAKQIDYPGTRGEDGSLTFAIACQSTDYGVQWGEQLTAGLRTDTGATNGTGVDMGTGSTSFGAQFFLQVTAFTGTSVTIKVQESSDNGGGDAFADVTGGAFTLVTGVTAERIATSAVQTVERYLRVVTSGTFSSVTFSVVAVRNPVATAF